MAELRINGQPYDAVKVVRLKPEHAEAASQDVRRNGYDDIVFRAGSDTYIASGRLSNKLPRTGDPVSFHDGQALREGVVMLVDDQWAAFSAKEEAAKRKAAVTGAVVLGVLSLGILAPAGAALGEVSVEFSDENRRDINFMAEHHGDRAFDIGQLPGAPGGPEFLGGGSGAGGSTRAGRLESEDMLDEPIDGVTLRQVYDRHFPGWDGKAPAR